MGEAARRHATDPDRRGSAQAAIDARADFARGSHCDLSAAVAPAGPLCRRDAGPVQGDATLSRRRRRQGALYHRRRRLGGGGQVDDRPRSPGDADAMAQYAQSRTHHHRRLSAPQRHSRSRGPDAAQGLSRKLRWQRAHSLLVGRQGGQAQCDRARSIRISSTTWCLARP